MRDYDGSIREIHVEGKGELTCEERAKVTGEKVEEMEEEPERILVPE